MNPRGTCKQTALAVVAVLALAGCGQKDTQLGAGGGKISGSAGPAGARQAASELIKCDAPVATVALVESPNGYVVGTQYNLPNSPVPLIRLLVQQSGCFRVVDRGAGLRGTLREQELKEAGVLREDSTVRKGRGHEAQYTLTPSLTFSEQDAGRVLGGLLAKVPYLNQLAGVAEQVKFKEAQVALILTDNETTEQLAAATGAARSTDLGLGGFSFGRGAGGAGVGWSNTHEAKVIVAAFLDAYNQLVPQVRRLAEKPLPPAPATKASVP